MLVCALNSMHLNRMLSNLLITEFSNLDLDLYDPPMFGPPEPNRGVFAPREDPEEEEEAPEPIPDLYKGWDPSDCPDPENEICPWDTPASLYGPCLKHFYLDTFTWKVGFASTFKRNRIPAGRGAKYAWF